MSNQRPLVICHVTKATRDNTDYLHFELYVIWGFCGNDILDCGFLGYGMWQSDSGYENFGGTVCIHFQCTRCDELFCK
jgi:hypothetical protein